ncbi:MAG: polyprenyl synthetase family protein [Alphaproteobacteria bacterium]|nr:polyprenyl synthetase family protein [Alphaproteobacteria bacterium]
MAGLLSLRRSGNQALATILRLEKDTRAASPLAPSLKALQGLVESDLSRVNAIVIERAQSPIPLIPQIARHLIAAGGKRIRPMLTLAAARLCGHAGDEAAVKLAAAVEFIHTATLLHDDVVDDSALRRGKSSANAVWGNAASVLVGDFLFTRSFQLMVETGSLRVLDILSHASSTIAEGEVNQLTASGDLSTSEAKYLDVISAKTAALFAAACRVGAVIAGRPPAEEEALDDYGRNIGIAFQLVDDVLDYAARQDKLGKTVGDDFREGKITLPVLLAYRRGDAAEREFWKRTIERKDQRAEDLDQAIRLMETHGAFTDSLARAAHYGDLARRALSVFPDRPEKTALAEAVGFAVQRGH